MENAKITLTPEQAKALIDHYWRTMHLVEPNKETTSLVWHIERQINSVDDQKN